MNCQAPKFDPCSRLLCIGSDRVRVSRGSGTVVLGE
jgi:hypothetical protein